MDSLSKEIKILPARMSDYENLLVLCRKSDAYFSHTDQSLKKWLAFSDKSNNRITEISYYRAVMVGFYSCAIFKYYAFGEILRVDKEFQRGGFGSLLVNRAVEITKSFNLNKLRTAVSASNYRAVNLFAKLNFHEIGRWEAVVLKPDQLSIKNKTDDDVHIDIAQSGDLFAILKFIKDKPVLFFNKMYVENFSWCSFDEDNVSDIISKQQILIKKNKNEIKSICLYSTEFCANSKIPVLEINYFNRYDSDFLRFILEKHQTKFSLFRFYAPSIYSIGGLPGFFRKNGASRLIFIILEKNF